MPEQTPTIRRPVAAAAAVLVSSFMSFFDFTAVYVVLPAIQDDLGAGYATVQWVAVGYTVPFALLLITGGRAGDVVGHRRAFLAGLVGFTVTSAAAGLVDDVVVLAAVRVLQGAAGALMAPQVLALFRVLVPEARRAVATIAYAATVGVATIAGPALGGWLAGADVLGLGWRAVLLVNVPLGVIALVVAWRELPVDRIRAGRLRPDLGGVGLATLALLCLLVPLLHGPQIGWPWWCAAGLVAAAPTVAVLVLHQLRRQRRGRETLLALPLFRIRAFDAGLAVNATVAAVLTGFVFALSVHLQDGLRLTPDAAGAAMAVAPVASMAASVAAPRLTPRLGRAVLVVGALLTLGAFLLVPVLPAVRGGALAAVLVLFGLGTGLVSTPVLAMTMGAVPVDHAGAAAGLFSTFRQVGAALGVALNGAVYFAALGTGAGPDAAIRAAALLDAGFAVLTLALLLLVPRRTAATTPAGAPTPVSS